MTAGLPIGLQQPRRQRQERVFDHIPRLRELLPGGGFLGITYVQSLVSNMKWAAERTSDPAYLTAIARTAYYTIRGPKGEAHMALLGSGEPIRGSAPEAGECLFFTDADVERATGLRPLFGIHIRPGSEDDGEVDEPAGGSQGREGDARVQARHAPQRKQARAEGHESQASGGDRDERKPKAKKLMPGHTHPANFGRIVEACPGCDKVLARRKEQS